MELIDTHAHLYADAFDEDRTALLQRLQAANIIKVYLPNIDATTIAPMLALSDAHPQLCVPMIGLHPCYVEADMEQQLGIMEQWLEKRSFAAIGEIGLDFFHSTAYRMEQEKAFERQLGWAKQYQLPVALHCRDSLTESIAIVRKHQDGTLRGVFHCFSGDVIAAKAVLELGFYLGIGGIVTFKNNTLAAVLAEVPLERVVLETDAPYLAPAPHRGKRNEPAYLSFVVDKLAEVYSTDAATIAAVTTQNAKMLFAPAVK